MPLFIVLGVILIASAVILLGFATRPAPVTGLNRSLAYLETLSTAPKELTQEFEPSFEDRVLAPLRARALGLGRRLTGADSSERMRRKLNLAGNPAGWTVDKVVSTKVLTAAGGLIALVLFAVLLHRVFYVGAIFAGFGLVVGFFAPDLWLYQKAHDRAEALRRNLPDAIDLMSISVEAGLGFDAAVQQVGTNTGGPLAEEFRRMLHEMQIGHSRAEALRDMAERSDVTELRGFVTSMIQADSFGIPIAQVLRVQASEIRVKRRQRAETKAQQVAVKITVPLIFCILPCLFVPIMGPAVLQIMDNM